MVKGKDGFQRVSGGRKRERREKGELAERVEEEAMLLSKCDEENYEERS